MGRWPLGIEQSLETVIILQTRPLLFIFVVLVKQISPKMFHRSANLIITSSVMGCLAITAVALRLWAKSIRRLESGADDLLIVGGLVNTSLFQPVRSATFANHCKILALALCVCNIVGAATFRFGDHELYVESGALEGYSVAWLLLGYGKVHRYPGGSRACSSPKPRLITLPRSSTPFSSCTLLPCQLLKHP